MIPPAASVRQYNPMRSLAGLLLVLTLALPAAPVVAQPVVQEYTVPAGSHPHDVAPAADGGVWFTAQSAGYLGWLDPNTGETRQIPLGPRSAPHGVIVGPDGAPWVTDGGQNAIVRVDPSTSEVRLFPLPAGRGANLNTAAFDRNGSLWFTGQSGVYGRVDPSTAEVKVWNSPRGAGPYGIIGTPEGRVFYASLAGSHIAEINLETGEATPIDSPTPNQGARRVWTDSHGMLWVSEWNVGQVGRYDPRSGAWREWKLPGSRPMTYAVYVDEQDTVWLTDFGANAIVRFDPVNETFDQFVLPLAGADVRQLNGRPGELWGAESGRDRIVVVRH
jgi:virginiamycin B lyase